MINREILYERNITGSYMKIPVSPRESFDEKIMLKRKLPGLLQVEKCYLDGMGQYWYNITGKQSLDTICKMKNLQIEIIERLIVSICSEIEILEWNLIDINCLMLDPEYIFVTNQNNEFIFTIYPGENSNLSEEFQRLMEYLLTKVDHSDSEAVRVAYSLYEKSFDESYSVVDIKDEIIKKKEVQAAKKYQEIEEKKQSEQITETVEKQKGKIQTLFDTLYKILTWKPGVKESKKREEKPELDWVSPDTPEETGKREIEINPTICISSFQSHPKGILKYEGKDSLEDITIEKEMTKIGQSSETDVTIKRETISHFHAKIEKEDSEYYLEDLNSTNGTCVNGVELSYKDKYKLAINDVVKFADVEYRFV